MRRWLFSTLKSWVPDLPNFQMNRLLISMCQWRDPTNHPITAIEKLISVEGCILFCVGVLPKYGWVSVWQHPAGSDPQLVLWVFVSRPTKTFISGTHMVQPNPIKGETLLEGWHYSSCNWKIYSDISLENLFKQAFSRLTSHGVFQVVCILLLELLSQDKKIVDLG